VHCIKVSPDFECQGQSQGHRRQKKRKNAESSPMTMRGNLVRRRMRCRPYAALSSRRLHCVAAGGDGSALHVDGGCLVIR